MTSFRAWLIAQWRWLRECVRNYPLGNWPKRPTMRKSDPMEPPSDDKKS